MIPQHLEAIFLDLDGTLLGYKDETMIELVFSLCAKHFPNHTEQFKHAFQLGVMFMHQQTSYEAPQYKSMWLAFVDKLQQVLGVSEDYCKARFTNAFQSEEYNEIQNHAKLYHEQTAKLVKIARERNIKLVLATSPVFPQIAIERRIRWAGMQPEDFVLTTHFENMTCCKSVAYYKHLLDAVGCSLAPEKTMMVGNDNKYDMVASELGIKTWLINEWERSERKHKIDHIGTLEEFVSTLEKQQQ